MFDFNLNNLDMIGTTDALDMSDAATQNIVNTTHGVNFTGLNSALNDFIQEAHGMVGNMMSDIAKPSILSDAMQILRDIFTGGSSAPANINPLDSANVMQFNAAGGNSLLHDSWLDGISYREITPEVIQDISSKMMELFGRYEIDIYQRIGYNNASMTLGEEANLSYDPNLLWSLSKQYGADAVIGVLAHEIGHHIVETTAGFGEIISDWHHEFCADYISGVIGDLYGVDQSVIDRMYSDGVFSPASLSHPNGGLRAEAYDMGAQWSQDSANGVFYEFLLKNNYELESMFSGITGSFPGSYEEYINM